MLSLRQNGGRFALQRHRQDHIKPYVNEKGELAVPIGRISNIQFSLVRAEESERTGIEVTKATVNAQHNISDGGLNSSFLGAQSRKEKCKTCKDDNMHCNMHKPILRLPIPVIDVECIRQLLAILKCVCPYCSRCLLRPSHRQYAEIMVCTLLSFSCFYRIDMNRRFQTSIEWKNLSRYVRELPNVPLIKTKKNRLPHLYLICWHSIPQLLLIPTQIKSSWTQLPKTRDAAQDNPIGSDKA